MLEETKNFRGSLGIVFFGFTLSEAHAEELLKVIGTASVLKEVMFLSNMTVSDPIKEKLKKKCRNRNVELFFN